MSDEIFFEILNSLSWLLIDDQGFVHISVSCLRDSDSGGEIRLLTQLTQNTKRKQEKWKTEPNILFSKYKYKCFLPSENTITTLIFLTKYMQWQKLDPTVKRVKIFGKLLFQYYGIATVFSDDQCQTGTRYPTRPNDF